jgi:thiamine-monophosphate kinase
MGSKPVGFVWSLEVPARWLKNSGALLKRFCVGAAKACAEEGLSFYGGDLSFSRDHFACTTTIFGDVAGRPLSRQGARPGDLIYVSRPLGLSSFGLELILRKLKTKRKTMASEAFSNFLLGEKPKERAAIMAHLWPRAELARAQSLVGKASACMDISDGLARDLHRLCAASKVGAELNNLEAAFHAALPKASSRKFATYGGEEYALLFCAPENILIEEGIRIGVVTDEVGVVNERRGRTLVPIKPKGYDHFTSRP